MGAANSVSDQAVHPQTKIVVSTEEEVIAFVMPIYYTKELITTAELDAATAAWKLIINDRSQYFHNMKSTTSHSNCMEHFYDLLYNRLFEVHPSCRALFKRPINKQGSFLVRMFSLILAEWQNDDKWTKSLDNLTHIHNKMGIKATECKYSNLSTIQFNLPKSSNLISQLINLDVDGILGECLFYSIRHCVGPDVYNQLVHFGWVKIYSRILATIVPVVVHFEMTNKDAARAIWQKREEAIKTVLGQPIPKAVDFVQRSTPSSSFPTPMTVSSLTSSSFDGNKTLRLHAASATDNEGK